MILTFTLIYVHDDEDDDDHNLTFLFSSSSAIRSVASSAVFLFLAIAPCSSHRPPWTATLVQSPNSHRFRAGPCLLHKPPFCVPGFVHPRWLHSLRLAPWRVHRPPCWAKLSQTTTVHLPLRHTRLLVPLAVSLSSLLSSRSFSSSVAIFLCSSVIFLFFFWYGPLGPLDFVL